MTVKQPFEKPEQSSHQAQNATCILQSTKKKRKNWHLRSLK